MQNTIGYARLRFKLNITYILVFNSNDLPQGEISWYFRFKLYLCRLFHRVISIKALEQEKSTPLHYFKSNDMLYLSLIYYSILIIHFTCHYARELLFMH